MAKKLSQEEFVNRIQSLNSDIEILGEYKSARTPILCRCKKCNCEWLPTPDNLSRRPRCPKCNGKHHRSNSEFVLDMKKINPDITVIGQFKTVAERVSVSCNKCGHRWNPVAASLLTGTGCPNCRNESNAKRFSMGEDTFLSRVYKEHPSIFIKGKYKNWHTKIDVLCKNCGYEWSPAAGSLLAGAGCPNCAGVIKKTTDSFREEMALINSDIDVIGNYKNAHSKIRCRCKKCNNIWESKPNNLLNGLGCPDCVKTEKTRKQTKSEEQFLKEMKDVSPLIEVLGKYKNSHSRVKCRCKRCNNIWNPIAWDIIRGNGCPQCSHTSTSFMEQFILLAFQAAVGEKNVLSRNRELIGMELDIYIPFLQLAIEPGSWIWHSVKVENDLEKRRKCKNKEVTLITLYDSFSDAEKPFAEDCYVFDFDLSQEENNNSLKLWICERFVEYGVKYKISEEEWKRIENEAYDKSRKKTTASFLEELGRINSNVIVLSEYEKSNKKISCQCKKCKYQWLATPSHLLQGEGCPKCAGKMRKTQSQFEEELSVKNDSILVVGTYVNNRTPIHIKCKKCNHEWNARPANLLNGNGCPQCAKEKTGRSNRLTHNEFLNRMSKRGNPDVEVRGQYINAKTKLQCRCRKCGFEWMATPNSLLQGHGCKKCADIATGNARRKVNRSDVRK